MTHDEEGVELADLDAAKEVGRREARYQAAESVRAHGHLIRSHKVVICDASGELATIAFGDVVSIG
ncbi:hypothetical protein M9978_18980 [Sphingomonas sp. MG17]|uniref:DUF6894 domain-containing protein n=1 Tax=Sphingomonas tagetis TaxID=2949092 RepID=A0A9X2HLW1_9SPHN|nr:hypothetical protein [Sphingomonas tagetis]MCP3732512.1 hypothetical protein [Sphingomonas tagetis]